MADPSAIYGLRMEMRKIKARIRDRRNGSVEQLWAITLPLGISDRART